MAVIGWRWEGRIVALVHMHCGGTDVFGHLSVWRGRDGIDLLLIELFGWNSVSIGLVSGVYGKGR